MEYLNEIIATFELRAAIYIGTIAALVASLVYVYRAHRIPFTTPKVKIVLSTISLVLLALTAYETTRAVRLARGVPSVRHSSPGHGQVIQPDSPDIQVAFGAPVLFKTLSVHTYPQIEFDIKYEGYLFNRVPLGTRLTIVPKTTLPPGERLMVYFSNIEGPFTRGFGGEHLLEMTIDEPNIATVEPPDNSTDVATTQSFTVTLTIPTSSQQEWAVRSDPPNPLVLEKVNAKTFRITPLEPFHQGTSYVLTLSETPKIISRADGTIVRSLDTKIKAAIHVTIVKPVFLSSFLPQGDGVNPQDPITLTFDQSMDKQSVIEHLTIKPPMTLRDRWDGDAKTLTLSHDKLQNDTTYTVTLKKGTSNALGGTLETDASYHFHTAGPVALSDTLPTDSAKNVSVKTTIRLQFNQKIPQKITDSFSISPSVEGVTTVSDSVLEFTPKNPLGFQTTYTARIASGAPSVYGLPSSKDQSISFTTSPDQVTLNVPFLGQQTLFTCNIAAARMLLAYRGISVTEGDLINVIGLGGKRGSGNPHKGYVDDYGTYWDPVLTGVTHYHPAHLITSGKLEDILSEVKKGNPVMTWGQNGWSDPHSISWTASDGTFINAVNGMHSMLVRGYVGSVTNPTQILINDPWRGQYAIDTAEFMRRWGYFSMALVIDP